MSDPISVDIYQDDDSGHTDVAAIINAGFPWCVIELKISQGTYYNSGSWGAKYWPLVRSTAIAAKRYGVDFWRMGYVYGDFTGKSTCKAQFDYAMKYVDLWGGVDVGDLPFALDVEQADNPAKPDPTKIHDFIAEFDSYHLARFGRHIICYGGQYLRDNGIKLPPNIPPWVAEYGPHLDPHLVTSLGVASVYDAFGWQYASADYNTTPPAGYPSRSPAGHEDLSELFIDGGGDKTLAWLRANTLIVPPKKA